MTFAADLAAVNHHSVDVTLFIDGIPILFGTRAGIVYPTSGGGITNPPAAGLASVAAIVPGSLQFDATRLDYDTMMVAPTSGGVKIRFNSPGDATVWDTYFMRRTATKCELTGDATETVTSLAVDNSDAFSANNPIYCNRETLLLTAVPTSTSMTLDATLGRNYCALAMAQKAAHKTGAVVSAAPLYLMGRMAELRMYLGQDGNTSAVVKLLVLSASPAKNKAEGVWDLQFDDAMRIFDRKVCVGIKGSDIDSGTLDNTSVADVVLEAYVPKETREFGTATNVGHMMFTGENGPPDLVEIYDFDGTTPRFRSESFFSHLVVNAPDGRMKPKRMQRCYVFTVQPMLAALQILLSDRGRGLNDATYDVLFGMTSTGGSSGSANNRLETDEVECRFGAAIPAALVDITALEAFLPRMAKGWYFVLHQEMSLLDVLEEVAWAYGGYWFITQEGKLSFKLLSGEPNATTYAASKTITESDWLPNSSLTSVDDEADIIHTVETKCNWDPFAAAFTVTANAIYEQERETFREVKGVLHVQRRGLSLSFPGAPATNRGLGGRYAGIPPQEFAVSMDRIFVRRSRGLRRYALRLPLKYIQLQPGDRVQLTSTQLSDFVSQYSTLSAFVCEVVSVKLDIGDKTVSPVEVEVNEVWASKRVAPTLQVASWDAGTNTATIKTASRWEDSPGTAAEIWFAVDWVVRFIDYSDRANDTSSGPHTVTALDSGAHTVTVGSAPSFVPAVDDLITLDTYDSAADTTANGAQGLAQHDYTFQADATNSLGAGRAAGDIWG